MSVNLARVVEVELEGENHLALELDPAILKGMNWIHGEMLFLEVSADKKSLTLKSTGYVHNEPGTA